MHEHELWMYSPFSDKAGGEGSWGAGSSGWEQRLTWLLSKLLNSLSCCCAPEGMARPLLDPPGAPRASLSLSARASASTNSVSESLRLSCLLLCEEDPGPYGTALSAWSLFGAGVAAAD